jgi:hypothetical protein
LALPEHAGLLLVHTYKYETCTPRHVLLERHGDKSNLFSYIQVAYSFSLSTLLNLQILQIYVRNVRLPHRKLAKATSPNRSVICSSAGRPKLDEAAPELAVAELPEWEVTL